MDKDELINKLENMQKPDIVSDEHRNQLKLTLLNARKSANVGIILIILPCLFLSGVILKYLLHLSIPAFTTLENWMAEIDKNPSLKLVVPVLLVGAPLTGLAINLLAILHFDLNRKARELIITVKVKWKNIIVGLICLLILMCFFFYAVGENFTRVR